MEKWKNWKRLIHRLLIDHVPQANWQEWNGQRGEERRKGGIGSGKGGHRAHLWHYNRRASFPDFACEPKNVTAEPATPSSSARVSSLAAQTSSAREEHVETGRIDLFAYDPYDPSNARASRNDSNRLKRFRENRDFSPFDRLALIDFEMQR